MFGTKNPEAADAKPSAENDSHLPVIIDARNIESRDQARGLVDADSVRSFAELRRDQSKNTKESYVDVKQETADFKKAKEQLLNQLVDQVDFVSLSKFEHEAQKRKVFDLCDKLLSAVQIPLNAIQVEMVKSQIMDDLFGFGPLEPLLAEHDVSDIMINGPHQVYIEKGGKLLLTDITFTDDKHLLTIIQRIVSRVGRRVDESSPMVDARMPDGSRFNAIIPPLALNGSLVSIRKFKKNKMPLKAYADYGSMTQPMYKFLEICSNIGLNIIISGGTGSGKTTLLNALSGGIDVNERIITIEDAAELQLQQPHVLRLETRPASIEGKGEVSQRQLVKNALRMRPDRIILGEIRGDEVIDVLSAMNTGHDGSMATIHANNPRDCLSRIENLVGMSAMQIGIQSLRRQIASAVQLIVQIERMRDGKRRIVAIEEVVGMEGDIITTQTLFSYRAKGFNANGELDGEFKCHGIRPKMISRAEYFGKEKETLECFTVTM